MHGVMQHLEPVHDLYGTALGRNRDEVESMERSWGSCPSEGQREEIARFRPNLKLGSIGQYLCGRSASLQFLPIASYWQELRLASHPAKALARRRKDREQVLRVAHTSQPIAGWRLRRGVMAQAVRKYDKAKQRRIKAGVSGA